MAETIMIIGAGLMQVEAIKIAKQMGLQVVATDYNQNSPGLKLADIPVVMSTRDLEGTVRKAKEINAYCRIDGVLTVGTDASLTVAAVASALDLPGIRSEVAERATNKIKMRERFAACGVSSPQFKGVWNLHELRRAATEIGFPVVVKPADNMGARGVRCVDSPSQLISAFHAAKYASPSGGVVVEQLIAGTELSIDALVYRGQVYFVGIADRLIKGHPYFIEHGHVLPTALASAQVELACEVMRQGIEALGIDIGAAKGDIRVHADGAMIVELAARLSGGFMSSYTYPLATGGSSIAGAIEIALGRKPTFTEDSDMVVIEHAIIPPPGRVESICGVAAALEIVGVEQVFVGVKEGDVLKSLTSNLGKAANVIVRAKSHGEAWALMEKALELVDIRVSEPDISEQEVNFTAKDKLAGSCKVCNVCDGRDCIATLPGMGAVGSGESFRDNSRSLAEIKINVAALSGVQAADCVLSLWGQTLRMPVLAAPITGALINLGGAISEPEYGAAVINGCGASGVVAFLGDCAPPEEYVGQLEVQRRSPHKSGIILKPRASMSLMITRLQQAEANGAWAVGVDIDAVALFSMASNDQASGSYSVAQLTELVAAVKIPFIVKGVMTPGTALAAVAAGAQAIVVSNHGGRVLDGMPGGARVLPEIRAAVGAQFTIIADGGVRSGLDVLKMLALGADLVMLGRPMVFGVVGGAERGVALILERIRRELQQAMLLTGCSSLADISSKVIFRGSQ